MHLNTDKMTAEKENGIGWVTFNNPARHNAVSLEMWQAIETIFDEYLRDGDIRIVVMRGAGGKSFVSGADISEFEAKRNNEQTNETYSRHSNGARAKMSALNKPLIAMIRGFCLGGGVATAMLADVRIASDNAQFGIPAARLGLAYTLEALQALSHLVGPANAKDILFTGRRFGAEEALRIGLVNRVVPDADLEEAVRSYAALIIDNAPLTVTASKVALSELLKDPDKRDLKLVERLNQACMESEDFAEGRRAFMEKRKPVFRGV